VRGSTGCVCHSGVHCVPFCVDTSHRVSRSWLQPHARARCQHTASDEHPSQLPCWCSSFPHNRGGAYATHSHHASSSYVFGSLTASGSVTPECVQLNARSLHVCNTHGCKYVDCWARGSIAVATHRADWRLCIGSAQSDRLLCTLEQGARVLRQQVGAPKCEMWCITSHTWVQCIACRRHTNVTCPRIGKNRVDC
jgi:hypothetical protein